MTFKTADNKYELGFGHMSKLGPEAQVYASNLNSKPTASDFAIYNQGQVILKDLVLETNTENGIPRAISGEGSVLIKGDVKIK